MVSLSQNPCHHLSILAGAGEHGQVDSSWRCAYDSTLPGTSGASQAQESPGINQVDFLYGHVRRTAAIFSAFLVGRDVKEKEKDQRSFDYLRVLEIETTEYVSFVLGLHWSLRCWHRHILKQRLPGLRLEVGVVVQKLQHMFRVRSACMKASQVLLHDMPAPMWDADLLSGSNLKIEGRTCAQEFVNAEALVYYDSPDGKNRYYGMRRSLYFFGEEAQEACMLEQKDLLGGLTVDTLRLLVQLHLCQSEGDACFILQRLGCATPLCANMKHVLSVVKQFCVVIVGPKAKELWGRSDNAPATGRESSKISA